MAIVCGTRADGVEIRSTMLDDPSFEPLQRVVVLPAGTVALWSDALLADDVDGQREACAALVRAHRLGVDVSEADAALRAVLEKPTSSPMVLRAAARAATILERRELAPQLAALAAREDRSLRTVVEPVLAQWRYAGLIPAWRARLASSETRRQERMLAYRCLGAIGDHQSVPPLIDVVRDSSRDFAERWEAATALGAMPTRESVAASVELARSAGETRRLAAAMLVQADGEQANAALQSLVVDADEGVVAIAWKRLLDIDPPACLLPARARLRDSSSALRLLAIRSLLANPSSEGVAELAAALNDVHPGVRSLAAEALVALFANDAMREAVRQGVGAALGAQGAPRAVVQGALIVGATGDRVHAPRLAELLPSANEDGAIASAWALCQLAEEDAAAPLVAELRRETERLNQLVAELRPKYAESPPNVELPVLDKTYAKLEHVILALGRMRRRETSALFVDYVLKPAPQAAGEPPALQPQYHDRLRAAAIWTLGQLYADGANQPSDALIAELVARMTDTTPIPAESDLVRQMAAVALARMGRRELIPQFTEFFDPDSEHVKVGRACGWALEKLTGSAPERNRVYQVRRLDWFLTPIER